MRAAEPSVFSQQKTDNSRDEDGRVGHENAHWEPACPACRGTAVYRFGFSPSRKQKYLCLLCGRQFVQLPERLRYPHKPTCMNCGRIMHLYRRQSTMVRFRCSAYPACKTYRKEPLLR